MLASLSAFGGFLLPMEPMEGSGDGGSSLEVEPCGSSFMKPEGAAPAVGMRSGGRTDLQRAEERGDWLLML